MLSSLGVWRSRICDQLTGSVDQYRCSSVYCGYSTNACNKCHCLSTTDTDRVRLARHTRVADVNVVIAGGKQAPCANAQGYVVDAGGVILQRSITHGRVGGPGSIGLQSKSTVGGVANSLDVVAQRGTASGRVEIADGVAKERVIARRRVVTAGGVT